MSIDLGNKFKGHDEDALQEDRKKKDQEFGSDDTFLPRVRLKRGINVLWMLPAIESMTAFYVRRLVHYRPFHVCGRPPKWEDPSDPGKLKYDNDFSKCYRCMTAWNTWDALGSPGRGDKDMTTPSKTKFRNDMPNDRIQFQVLNLTPFFKLASDGVQIEFDKKMGKYMDDYLKLLKTPAEEFEGMEVEDIAEELSIPESIVEAAIPGVDAILLNEGVGNDIIKEERVCRVRNKVSGGPALHPNQYLLRIDKEGTGRTFPGAGGDEVEICDYDPIFEEVEWDMPQALVDIVTDQATDLNNLEPADDSLTERAFAFQKLNTDEIKEYLEECNHTFHLNDDGVEVEEADDDFDAADPDAFDSDHGSVLSTDQNQELANLRAKLAKDAEA